GGDPQPSEGDYSTLQALTAFSSTGFVDSNLVLYVGVSSFAVTPNGPTQSEALYAFTDDAYNPDGTQDGTRVNPDGSSGCNI
ncbi:MAG: hypothetical protein MRY64_11300, partial [Hyphomonadaceae bacterium]|nr:hypothetical protein [Hyphomonadaceae bacterium]